MTLLETACCAQSTVMSNAINVGCLKLPRWKLRIPISASTGQLPVSVVHGVRDEGGFQIVRCTFPYPLCEAFSNADLIRDCGHVSGAMNLGAMTNMKHTPNSIAIDHNPPRILADFSVFLQNDHLSNINILHTHDCQVRKKTWGAYFDLHPTK